MTYGYKGWINFQPKNNKYFNYVTASFIFAILAIEFYVVFIK